MLFAGLLVMSDSAATSWTTACQFITAFYFKDLLQRACEGLMVGGGDSSQCIFGLIGVLLLWDLNLKSAVGGM